MQLRLPSKVFGYYPEALGVFLAIDEIQSFHSDLCLLHPADIFSSTFDEFAQSALLLLRKVNEIGDRSISDDMMTHSEGDEISHLTQNLFLCADNFLNGCRSILRCTKNDVDKETTKLLREFDSQVRQYASVVSKIINYIKHRHRKIRTIYCTSNSIFIIGYFVEGVVGKGLIGPDPDIHANSDCAISFNRDIPFHVANVYLCAGIAGALCKKAFHISTPIQPQSVESPALEELFERCSKLASNYFIDEVRLESHPQISKKGNGEFEVSISNKNKPSNRHPHLQNFTLRFKVPHMYRSIKIPYLQRR
jgi:hypothetical protein